MPGWAALGFGFAELGGVTWHAQPGNPRPRMFRAIADEGVINRMGFNNSGAEAVAEKLSDWKKSGHWPAHPVGINLGKSKITPLQELNSSERPILVKVAPDLSFAAIDEILELVAPHHIAGIVATNTTISRPPTNDTALQKIYAETGGLSGRPLRARSTEIVRHLFKQTNGKLPIIGVGGIFDADDAWEKITAGASLVQVYTGMVYEGPGIAKKIVAGLRARLEISGLKNLPAAVGSAN